MRERTGYEGLERLLIKGKERVKERGVKVQMKRDGVECERGDRRNGD